MPGLSSRVYSHKMPDLQQSHLDPLVSGNYALGDRIGGCTFSTSRLIERSRPESVLLWSAKMPEIMSCPMLQEDQIPSRRGRKETPLSGL